MGLRFLTQVLLDPHYLFLYIKLFIVFFILTFNGFVIFYSLFKVKNKYLLFGGSMIVGPLIFLLMLSIFSYIFKGPVAIASLFIIYTIICIFLFKFNKFSFLSLIKFKKSINNFLVLSLTIFYMLFILINSGNASIGGDSLTYWGIATSFARGNYPTVLPWQPNFLTVYHQGAFMVQGAIHSLASINVSVVHTFFSAYIISAIFLFVTGLARERTRSVLCLVPAIFGLILFGGPLIYFFKLNSQLLSWIKFLDPTAQVLPGDFNIFSQFADFKKSLGAGANNLDSLIYLNFHAFGIANFFLFLYTLFKFPNNQYKNILLVVLMALNLSTDESVFLVEMGIFVLYFIRLFTKTKPGIFIKQSFLLLILFIILFFLIQNPIRDSLFTAGNKEARFRLLSTDELAFFDRVGFMHGILIDPKNLPIFWYIPDLRLSTVLVLILSILKKSKLSTVLVSTSLISLFFSLLIVNTYWPQNGLRFTNLSYELLMYSIGFLILDLFLHKRKVTFLLAIIALIILPQFAFANIRFFKDAFTNKLQNLTRGIKIQDKTLDWISNNISYDKKFLFIDGYGQDLNYSPMTVTAIEHYGILTPTVTPKIKVLNHDFEGEWYDAQLFLSSRSLAELNIDYIFIKASHEKHFSDIRQKQLNDSRFFKLIYSNENGKLYKVDPAFKKEHDKEMTLAKLADSIPDGKTVYLGQFKYPEIRKGLLINLHNRTRLIGPRYHAGYDQPLYIESFLKMIPDDRPKVKQLKELEEVEFVLIDPSKNPRSILDGQFEKLVEIRDVSLYKRYK